MGDGHSVAKRARVKRFSQSFSRAEVLFLKRLLQAVYDPGRVRDMVKEPAYSTVLHKASQMVRRADAAVAEWQDVPTATETNAAFEQRIIADYQAAVDAGRKFNIAEYSSANGLSEAAVARVTKPLRGQVKPVAMTAQLATRLYEDFRTLRAAKLWDSKHLPGLANLHGIGVMVAKKALHGAGRRFFVETPIEQRVRIVGIEGARALLRRIEQAGYVQAQEAAE